LFLYYNGVIVCKRDIKTNNVYGRYKVRKDKRDGTNGLIMRREIKKKRRLVALFLY